LQEKQDYCSSSDQTSK